jgi:hypothetical protein
MEYSGDQFRQRDSKEQARKSIEAGTSDKLDSLHKDIKLLSDLNNDSAIDSTLRDIVDEKVLATVLSRVTNGWEEAKMKEVYNKITGTEMPNPLTQEAIKDFQIKLRSSLSLLQQLAGTNAGLYTLLSGNTDKFVEGIQERLNAKWNKPIALKGTLEGMSPQTQTIIGTLVTTGAAVLTGGMVTAWHEAESATADIFIKKLEAKMDSSLSWNLKWAVNWVKEALMWRKLAFTLGKDKMNVAEFEDKILSYTQEIMALPADSKNPDLSRTFAEAKRVAGTLGISMDTQEGKLAIQKALIQSYVQTVGIENAGVDGTAKIGLFFIGYNRDAINVNMQKTGPSIYNDIEKKLTKRELTSGELKEAGIKIEKPADGKWNHTIPATLRFAGDIQVMKVDIVPPVWVDLKNSDKVYDMHFSDPDSRSGAYKVTFTERNPQPEDIEEEDTAAVDPIADINTSQDARVTSNMRESRDKQKEKSNLAGLLYNVVWHSEPKVFAPLIDAINSWDSIAVISAIDTLKKAKYPSLARMLKADIANFTQWTSYMYGTKDTKWKDNPTQPWVDKLRKPDVLKAEGNLAKSKWLPESGISESALKIDSGTHSAKQASAIFPWQEMTLSVFATPRGWYHRIDTTQGSLAMSEKYQLVTDSSYKNAIIDNTQEKVNMEANKLKTFLQDIDPKITINSEKYTEYLKTWNIQVLWVEGLSLQAGKDTKYFEGRAMIAWNVCMNRMHGIVYPLFTYAKKWVEWKGATYKSIDQKSDPVASMDASAMTNIGAVETQKWSVGINPAVVIANQLGKKQGSVDKDSSSTPGNSEPTPIKPTPTPTPKIPDSGSLPWSGNLAPVTGANQPAISTAVSGSASSTVWGWVQVWSRGAPAVSLPASPPVEIALSWAVNTTTISSSTSTTPWAINTYDSAARAIWDVTVWSTAIGNSDKK